jgi:S1-C subfamily serine protease
VQTLTKELAERLKIAASDGVVVTDVADSSAAPAKGLQRGDVITSVNRAPPIRSRISSPPSPRPIQDKGVLVYVKRGSATTFVVLKDSK